MIDGIRGIGKKYRNISDIWLFDKPASIISFSSSERSEYKFNCVVSKSGIDWDNIEQSREELIQQLNNEFDKFIEYKNSQITHTDK